MPKMARDAELAGSERGKVNIRVTPAVGLPEEMKLFFTQHLSEHRKQDVFAARTGQDISVDLPAGEYTLQILARGFDTFRGLVNVDPQRPFAVDAVLRPSTKKMPSTFEERLAKYGIDASKTEIGELNILPRTTRVLNYRTDSEKRGFHMLSADSIANFKQWVGSDDARFGHDRPVFGPLPALGRLAGLRQGGIDLRELSSDEINAVTAIAREYVHGNSKAVAQYEPLLNEAIRFTTRDFALKIIPLYFYRIVTIGAGATLEIGNGSAIFSCDELRIHKTGKLKPVDSVTIEIGTYTEFG
jgi:hypothetical protein